MSQGLAVIFDMDGVLVDSFQAHCEAWRMAAARDGRSFDPDQFALLFGRISREVIAGLWGEEAYTAAGCSAFDDRREAIYRDIIREQFPAMPGARELIQALDRDGFTIALASSGPPENAELVLEKLGARHLFQAVITAKDIRRGKPDPEIFLTAAARLGIPPWCCAVIEDAPAGIAGANAGGMTSIGLVPSGRARETLSAASLIVDSLSQLSPALIREKLQAKGRHS